MISIRLSPEYIFSVFGVSITNTFFTSIIVSLLLMICSVLYFYQKKNSKFVIIKGLEVLVYELLKLVDSVTNNRELSKKILPLIATFFLFIVLSNVITLVPGFLGSLFVTTSVGNLPLLRSPNSDLTVTLALALISVISIQYFSLRVLGLWRYIGRFINFSSLDSFFLGFFELLSELVKILSFSFRLFGNIFAGEVLFLTIAFLVPYIVPVPFMLLELFVGIIQAFIFALLTLVFVKTGTMRHLESTPQS